MSLSDLNKELYKANSEVIPGRTHEYSDYDPVVAAKNESPFNRDEIWQKESREITRKKRKKALKIGLSVFFAILLIVGGVYFYRWWQKNAFNQDRVEISFEGPNEADSTQLTKYIIHYKNNNRVTLKNAEIRLSYSENFQPTDNTNLKYLSPGSSKIFIGDIKPNGEGTIELKGVFYAPKDYPVFLHGEIAFTPSNGTKELTMDSQIGIKITAAPVVLELTLPNQAANGDELEYVLNYKNLDTRNMSDAQIRIDFPQGFKIESADPRPSEKDSYWYLGNMEANQEGTIRVRGYLYGDDGESKNIVVSLGHIGSDGNFIVFSKQESNTQIVSPLLTINQSLEDHNGLIINAGDVIKYLISYKNTSNLGLRNAIITAEIKSKVLDFSKINIDKGSFNGKTGIITWKASDVPELANINPGGEGKVRFSIPVKNVIPIENKLDKNLIVSSIAKIDSPDIPTPIDSNKIIGSNKLDLKLASKVLFDTNAYYNDEKIKNSGPIPMETGNETTFSVHWSVSSVSNDLSGAQVISSLPSGVRWTGKVYPLNEKISYNERTNQIIWELKDVPAGSGVLESPRTIEFQVGVTPQINQVGQPLVLVNQSTFTAKDVFVDQDISIDDNQKDTQLAEDPSVGYTNGKVAK